MKCEKCGKEITHITTNRFFYDGSDYDDTIGIEEDEHFNAVIMETDRDWTGYGLTEEEMRERIGCPYCKQFPFGNEEIQVYDVVRIVCFKTDHPTEKVCTGKRCPMQVGYDVKNCKDKDCIYRTETEKGGVE